MLPLLPITHHLLPITYYPLPITYYPDLVQMFCKSGMLPRSLARCQGNLREICNYFIKKTTSGVMEGLNNKIKLIIRQSYGFRNLDSLKVKLFACFNKPSLAPQVR